MIVDTGVLVGAADAADPRSEPARAVLEGPGDKVVTDAIISEAHHLIARRVGWGIAAIFLRSIDHGLYVECSQRADRERATQLCRTYLDGRLDYTDALTVAIAERLDERVVATFDSRHFRVVRPLHVDSFEIIP